MGTTAKMFFYLACLLCGHTKAGRARNLTTEITEAQRLAEDVALNPFCLNGKADLKTFSLEQE